MDPTDETVIAETRAWVDRVVIGLNLCPFAKAVQVKGQIRYVVSPARDVPALIDTLQAEMAALVTADPAEVDTTLVIHPHVLEDFLDYNDFLESADQLVEAMGLEGVLQVASFHPRYQFADSRFEEMGNATNRSPYPTLHLLREASVDRAVDAFPEAEAIFERNIRVLEALGSEGFAELQAQCRADARGR